MSGRPTIHASAALYDGRGVLVRGASGAGKSRLVLDLIDDAVARGRDAALIADDRVEVEARHGRLLARAPRAIAGLVELRGFGMVRMTHETACVVGLVVDIEETQPPRMPEDEARIADIAGIPLPCLKLWREDPRGVVRVRNALRSIAESP
jgi:serine kinase of HPr protein (carbohydrate metabolism regulator)